MKRTGIQFFFDLMAIFILFVVSATGLEAGERPLEKNGITRQFDHVIVKGKEFHENLNKSISLMGLYAFEAGKMEPIAFQVDEITEEGDWVLPHKSPYLDDKMSEESILLQDVPPEVLDENDELVFMITDIGDRVAPSGWPDGWRAADEITLTDPVTKAQGWAYLFSFAQAPTLSPVDYVEYRLPENKKDRIYTDNYTLGFSHEVPITQDYLDYGDGVNLLDRMKMRSFFRFFGIFKFSRNENDMASCVWQYKDGPVRVVRMVRSSIRLIRNLQSPKINSETLYYRNGTLMPIRMKIPSIPKSIVNEAYIDSGGDYRNLYGWRVRLNTDERWLSVDGKMDCLEKNINIEGARWYIIKGDRKAMLVNMRMLGDYGLSTQFNYLDDDINFLTPEFHPGQVPYIGFKINDFHKLGGRKELNLNAIVFYLRDIELSEEELVAAMNEVDHPIKVETQGFKR